MVRQVKQTNKKSDKNIESTRSWGWRACVYLFNFMLLGAVAVAGYVGVIYLQMPSLDSILHETRSAAVIFLDKNGDEIRSANRIMGTPVSTETLPPYVWQAIVAIEDKRFFEHGPIDVRQMPKTSRFKACTTLWKTEPSPAASP